jgi:hypothetical protein
MWKCRREASQRIRCWQMMKKAWSGRLRGLSRSESQSLNFGASIILARRLSLPFIFDLLTHLRVKTKDRKTKSRIYLLFNPLDRLVKTYLVYYQQSSCAFEWKTPRHHASRVKTSIAWIASKRMLELDYRYMSNLSGRPKSFDDSVVLKSKNRPIQQASTIMLPLN